MAFARPNTAFCYHKECRQKSRTGQILVSQSLHVLSLSETTGRLAPHEARLWQAFKENSAHAFMNLWNLTDAS